MRLEEDAAIRRMLAEIDRWLTAAAKDPSCEIAARWEIKRVAVRLRDYTAALDTIATEERR